LSKTLITSLAALILIAGCQQEIISHNPESRAAGEQEYNAGNYADAAGSFRNAVRADPRDYRSLYGLAQCYEKMGQHQNAIQAYKASLDAQPLTLAGKDDMAQQLRTINALAAAISASDNRDAEVDIIDKQAKRTNQPMDYLLLAKIYQNRGDADSALDAYNRAAIKDPKDFIILKEYGLYLEQLGEAPRATTQLRKAYSVNPDDAQVNAALYRLHVIPGPGLKDESQLAKPAIPQLSGFHSSGSPSQTPAPARQAAPTPTATYTPPPASPAPTAQPSAAPAPPTGSGLPTVPRATAAEPRD
jgi:tetratricopeptide (TPR) repeat protein